MPRSPRARPTASRRTIDPSERRRKETARKPTSSRRRFFAIPRGSASACGSSRDCPGACTVLAAAENLQGRTLLIRIVSMPAKLGRRSREVRENRGFYENLDCDDDYDNDNDNANANAATELLNIGCMCAKGSTAGSVVLGASMSRQPGGPDQVRPNGTSHLMTRFGGRGVPPRFVRRRGSAPRRVLSEGRLE
jgi:hypothetical protein